jgi:Cu/Ag efflux protein CusF
VKYFTYSSKFILVLIIGSVYLSCAKKEAVVEDPKTYEAVGVVVSVDLENSYITINHEKITGFMAAMAMPFSIADTTILKGFQKGDKINFTIEVTESKFVVTKIEKVNQRLE